MAETLVVVEKVDVVKMLEMVGTLITDCRDRRNGKDIKER